MKDKKLADFLSFNTACGLRNFGLEIKEKAMIHSNNNTTYYINPAYLTFVENSGYGANLIQVSASSSCYIRVFVPGVIGYDGDGNYRRWKITAYNNKFPDNDLFYIYVRLERNGASALIAYSKTMYNIDGSTPDGSVASSDTYYYIRIGEVSATDGTSIRGISYDTGRLESDQVKNEGTEMGEMWEMDKISSPWLIKAKQWLASFTVKGFITLVGGLIFKHGETEKPVTDIKRSTDSDEEVPVDDSTIPTTKCVQEMNDGRYLSKVKNDETEFHVTFGDGITTSRTEYKVVRNIGDGTVVEVVKPVTDIKRSSDSDEEVPLGDTNVTTSGYLEKRIEGLDDRYLSKIKPDETPYHVKLLDGLTTTHVKSKDYAEGTEKGGWAFEQDVDEYWKGEADKLVARVLGQVYDLLVQRNAVFKGPLSSNGFVSGFTGGKGWAIRLQEYINAAGQAEQRSVAEFDDLIVRGSMRVFEFIVNQMLGENDNRIFTGMMEVDHYDGLEEKIYLSTNGGKLYNPFRVDDIIIVQQYGGMPSEDNDYYVTKQYEFLVTEVGIGDMAGGEDRLDWVKFKNFSSPMEGADLSLITKGDTLVRIDNLYDVRRKGIVEIMSVGEDTPYIDILYGAKTDPDNCVKGRIGNMGGLYSPLFGWLQDFGAYLVNLYAIGEFRIAHTGEDVSDAINIAKGMFRTNFRQTTYDMTEEENLLTNASMTNDCEGWILTADEGEYFTIGDEPEFFNYELMSSFDSFAGIAELYGRDMLRLSNGKALQENSLIRKPGTHKEFTSTTENKDGSITKNYDEVLDTTCLSLRVYCEVSGTLEFGFADNGGVFHDDAFHRVEQLDESVDAYTFLLEGKWNGEGNFVIQSTGDMYIDLLSLTNRPLDNFKITTETSIEQDAERISLLGKKVNGMEGSVTQIGIDLNAAEERIQLYVEKELEDVSASIAQLNIKDGEISSLVASAQGSADNAKKLADAAQDAADAAANKADKAQNDAAANATAITQTNSSLSLLAGAFTLENGKYVLTSAAGATITSEVAKLYATKTDVDKISGDISEINADLEVKAGQIEARATKAYVDTETGKVNTAVSTLSTSVNGITGRVASLEGDNEDTQQFIKDSENQFQSLSSSLSGLSNWKDSMANAGLTTTMIQQSKDAVNIVSGTFEKQSDGTYKLKSAAGTLIESKINEAVASTYATLDGVNATMQTKVSFDPNTKKVTSEILLSADQINISANEYIGIINKGTTTISASRINLDGVVTYSMLSADLKNTLDTSELDSAVAKLNSTIGTLQTKADAEEQNKNLTDKVTNLNNALSGKADSSALGSLAYLNDVANAALGGSTLIVGGYLNTDLIAVRKIYADEGTVGGYEISETELKGSGTLPAEGNTHTWDTSYTVSLKANGISVNFGDGNKVESAFGVRASTVSDTYVVECISIKNNQDNASRRRDIVCALQANLKDDDFGLVINGGSTHILSSGITKLYGLVLNHRSVSSSITLSENDDIVSFSNTSNITVTLPTSVPVGKVYFLKNIGSANVTLSGRFRDEDEKGSTNGNSRNLDGVSWMVVNMTNGWTLFRCG